MPIVDLIKRFAQKKNATPAQISLAWLLAQKPFIVPIPGTRNVDHLNENLGAINVQLTPVSCQGHHTGEICGREIPRQVRGKRREEVLLEAQHCCCRSSAVMASFSTIGHARRRVFHFRAALLNTKITCEYSLQDRSVSTSQACEESKRPSPQISFIEGLEGLTFEFLRVQRDLCPVKTMVPLCAQPASASRSGSP